MQVEGREILRACTLKYFPGVPTFEATELSIKLLVNYSLFLCCIIRIAVEGPE